LFTELMERADQGVSVLAVIAHEFGHIAQYKSGVDRELLENQSTVKRLELHADYLSGYYLAISKSRNPNISLRVAGRTIYEIGDFSFTDPGHHGTPDERIASAEKGYAFGNSSTSFPDAITAGARYVLQTYS
jgi:hypothetical protein